MLLKVSDNLVTVDNLSLINFESSRFKLFAQKVGDFEEIYWHIHWS